MGKWLNSHSAYIDFSGRFGSDLFIGIVKGTENDIFTVWKESKVIQKLQKIKKLRTKDKRELILELSQTSLRISLGYFLGKDYLQYRNLIDMKQDWKGRLLSILLYLTMRNLFGPNKEVVFIEEGEYDAWIPQITNTINRFTRPFGTNVEINTENKRHPAIMIADYLSRIAHSEHRGEISFNSINPHKVIVVKNINLDYYVKKAFKIESLHG